jgi:hypothetical protein
MATQLRLTNKRKAWAQARTEAPTFKGTRLQTSAAVQTRYVIAITSMVAQMTAQTNRDLKKLFESETGSQHFAQDATIASQSRILVSALGEKFNALFAKKAKPLAEGMVKQSEAASASSLHSSLEKLSGGMSLKTSGMPAALAQVYKASVAENVSLIKSISSQYMTRV